MHVQNFHLDGRYTNPLKLIHVDSLINLFQYYANNFVYGKLHVSHSSSWKYIDVVHLLFLFPHGFPLESHLPPSDVVAMAQGCLLDPLDAEHFIGTWLSIK